MVRLLVATINWHKSLQFAKKSNITLLPCLFMILLAVSIIILRVNVSFQARVVNSIPGLIHAHAINTKPNRIFSFFIPFPIPWGVIISKRSTEIIT